MIIWVVKIFFVQFFCVFFPPLLNIFCFCSSISFLFFAAAAAAKSLQSCPTLQPLRQQPTRLPHPWDSPGKNTGVGCHVILQFCSFPLFLCIDHWGRLSYLSLLFFGTLHSNGFISSFRLCFSLLFFSQLFVRPPQTAILLFRISFSWGWSCSLSPTMS